MKSHHQTDQEMGPFFTWKEQLAETSVGKIYLSYIVDFKKVWKNHSPNLKNTPN